MGGGRFVGLERFGSVLAEFFHSGQKIVAYLQYRGADAIGYTLRGLPNEELCLEPGSGLGAGGSRLRCADDRLRFLPSLAQNFLDLGLRAAQTGFTV